MSRKKKSSPQQSPRWLRNQQLADYFGVTVMTVWRWKQNDKLKFPPARLINGIEYNNFKSVDAWMRKRPVRRGRPSKAQNTNQEIAAV
jgi:hypothetical protein